MLKCFVFFLYEYVMNVNGENKKKEKREKLHKSILSNSNTMLQSSDRTKAPAAATRSSCI